MERAPEDHFRFRVSAPDPAHYETSLFGIQYIGGLAFVHGDAGAFRLQWSSPHPASQMRRRPV